MRSILDALIARFGGPDPPLPPAPPLPVYGPLNLWEWVRMAGSCHNGAERDGGRTRHLRPNNRALGLPEQWQPLCSARAHSYWVTEEPLSRVRECPTCLRFKEDKAPCRACGRWVLKTKGGGLRAHACNPK